MRKEYIYVIVLVGCILAIIYGIVGLIRTAANIQEAKIDNIYENIYENSNTVATVSTEEEKVSPNSKFALKKVYDECNHFDYEEVELPKELVNLTRQEVEDYYDEWEVEEFEKNKVVLCKEINGYCNQHFVIKLDDSEVKVYRLGTNGELNEYKTTEISKEYLPEEDIEKLEDGIMIYGEGKISAALEDYE